MIVALNVNIEMKKDRIVSLLSRAIFLGENIILKELKVIIVNLKS